MFNEEVEAAIRLHLDEVDRLRKLRPVGRDPSREETEWQLDRNCRLMGHGIRRRRR